MLCRLKSPKQPLKSKSQVTEKTKTVKVKYQTDSKITLRSIPSIHGEISTDFQRKNATDEFSTKQVC